MSGYMGNGPGRGQRQAFSFTATASQTTFSGKDSIGLTLTYKPKFIDVYVNGLCIPPSEYTATNGSTIVFGFGLNAGDVVYVVSMSAFDVANTLALDQDGADISNKANFRSNLGVSYASKVEQQTGTEAAKVLTPARQQDHDSAAKHWCYLTWDGSNHTLRNSYNYSGFVRGSAGRYTITLATAFSTAYFACLVSPDGSRFALAFPASASSVTVSLNDISGAAADAGFSLACFGRQ